jgi:hypothetical protein
MSNFKGDTIKVTPKGIDKSKEYTVTLDNENCTFKVSGYELSKGIDIQIPSSLDSELILYKET